MTWKQFYHESYFKQRWNPKITPQEYAAGLQGQQIREEKKGEIKSLEINRGLRRKGRKKN